MHHKHDHLAGEAPGQPRALVRADETRDDASLEVDEMRIDLDLMTGSKDGFVIGQ